MTCPSVSLHAERCQREPHTSGEHVHRSDLDLNGLVSGAGPVCIEKISTWTDAASRVPGTADGVVRLLARHGAFLDEVSA